MVNNNKAILKAVVDGQYTFKPTKWSRVSEEAQDLISKMLTYNSGDRISAADALDHEWFKKFDNGELESVSLKSAFDGLKKFEAKQKMQQAVLGYLVIHLTTKEDLEEFDKVFKNLDNNHDGKVSKEEFLGKPEIFEDYGLIYFQQLNKVYPELSNEDLEALFDEADTNKSGYIDYIEWAQATINKKMLIVEDNLKDAFDAFDEDKNGVISLDEIKSFLA